MHSTMSAIPSNKRKFGMGSGNRIPESLKAVFLASNGGQDVNTILQTAASYVSEKKSQEQIDSERRAREMIEGLLNMHSEFQSEEKQSPSSSSSKVSARCVSYQAFEVQQQSSASSLSSSPAYNQSVTNMEMQLPSPPVITVAKPTCSETSVTAPTSPQEYLDAIRRSRGYSTDCYHTLQTAYYNKPTSLQLASYDAYLVDLVRRRDLKALEGIIQSGISLNPCNVHGESLLHTICRLGDAEILQMFIRGGCTVQVSDDYGRTPLHDACWTVTPNFQVVEDLLQADLHLLNLLDARGTTPLMYVRKENWKAWVEFLESKKDIYWAPRNTSTAPPEAPPLLALHGANTRPVADPSNALETRLAMMVVSGKMKPKDVEFLRRDVAVVTRRNFDFDCVDLSDSDLDSEYDSDEDEECEGHDSTYHAASDDEENSDDDSMESDEDSDDEQDDEMSLLSMAISGRFSIKGT